MKNRIINSLSDEGQQILRRCDIVFDTQLSIIKLSDFLDLPERDRQVIERELKTIPPRPEVDVKPWLGIVDSDQEQDSH